MIEQSEFRGHKIIILKRDKDDKYPFQFGAGKAKLIIDNIDEIKKFWEENALKGPTEGV
jgi:hypothetical protein